MNNRAAVYGAAMQVIPLLARDYELERNIKLELETEADLRSRTGFGQSLGCCQHEICSS